MAFIVVDSFTEFPINCYLCGESFRRPRDLSDHERVRHPRGFQCGCGRNYETTYQLRKHSFKRDCFTYTLYSWASRKQARSSSNRNSKIRTCFVLEDAPPPSHHGIDRQRLSIKAFWSYLDLCGSTLSYIYNLSLALLQAHFVR